MTKAGDSAISSKKIAVESAKGKTDSVNRTISLSKILLAKAKRTSLLYVSALVNKSITVSFIACKAVSINVEKVKGNRNDLGYALLDSDGLLFMANNDLGGPYNSGKIKKLLEHCNVGQGETEYMSFKFNTRSLFY